MSSTPASLAELLDRAGDREDQKLLDQAAAVAPVEIIGGWQRGDDDVLPHGHGRTPHRLRLRWPFGS